MTKNHSGGFTLIELLLVIAVIAILISIGYPALIGALERAKVTKDMNNLRQIGIGIQIYLNDHDNALPVINAAPGTGTTASQLIYPKYISSRAVFQSPFDHRGASELDSSAPFSYGINANMYVSSPGINGVMSSVVSPALTIFMAPNYNGNPGSSTSWKSMAATAPYVANLTPGGGSGMTTGPQNNGVRINALFCDCHIETMTFGTSNNPSAGSFKDTSSNPLGLKHWDPTQ